MGCELLDVCGFFKKYQHVKETACKGFINMYCNGPKMDECMRKKYRMEHGVAPPDDMLTNGMKVPESWKSVGF